MTAAHLAIVLAAGGSTRLGQPKQLLTRDGEPLVHRVARLAIGTQPLRTIVVLGAHADAISDALSDLDVEIAINAEWRDGLSTSLRAAAAIIGNHVGPVLLSVCDQPALGAQHLRALLDGAAASPARIAATCHGDARGTPVVVLAALLLDVATNAESRDATSGRSTPALTPARHDPARHDPARQVSARDDRDGENESARGNADRGLGARLRDVPSDRFFLLDAPELRFDIDTPADLRRAIELGLVDRDCAR